MKWITSRVGVRLFLSYLAVVLLGMAVLFVAARLTAPGAYNRHLFFMEMQMSGGGMMHGQGQGQGPGPAGGFFQDYLASFNEALLVAAGFATLAAMAASILLSRGITSPIRRMMNASQRIAGGDYAGRVEVTGTDEIAELGAHFNNMASQLQHVEEMRRQLIADVSHELRTPLTAIQGSMEGLIDGVLPADAETFEQIHREAGRLSRLVDDLQELSRVESQAYQLDLRPVDLSMVVRTVMKRLSFQFEEKGVSLQADLPAEPLRAQADSDRVEQVLTNLLGNALHYTLSGGSVKIAAAVQGDMLEVSVIDTGIGIPREHLDHVFDRFYRVDKSRSRARGGSGIGLTIAKHLVESHGGRIWAESEGVDKGSRLVFTLPRVAE